MRRMSPASQMRRCCWPRLRCRRCRGASSRSLRGAGAIGRGRTREFALDPNYAKTALESSSLLFVPAAERSSENDRVGEETIWRSPDTRNEVSSEANVVRGALGERAALCPDGQTERGAATTVEHGRPIAAAVIDFDLATTGPPSTANGPKRQVDLGDLVDLPEIVGDRSVSGRALGHAAARIVSPLHDRIGTAAYHHIFIAGDTHSRETDEVELILRACTGSHLGARKQLELRQDDEGVGCTVHRELHVLSVHGVEGIRYSAPGH